MLFLDLLGWWYSAGWNWLIRTAFLERSRRIVSFFSIFDLLRTLFAPFRQDSYDTKNAPVGVRLQAFGGNLISRFFGLIIRSTLICCGLLLLLINCGLSVVMALLWPLLPLTPILVIILVVAGVGGRSV